MPIVTRQVTKDAAIASSSFGAGLEPHWIMSLEAGLTVRTLVDFEAIPAGITTLNYARIHMHRPSSIPSGQHDTPNVGAQLVPGRITGDWSEGDKGANHSYHSGNAVVWPGPAVTGELSARGSQPSAGEWWHIDVSAIVQSWIDGQPQKGIRLRNANEGGSDIVTDSRHVSNTSHRPYLEISYSTNTAPNAPSDLSPADGTIIGSSAGTSATVSGRHSDPDGDTATRYQAQWFPASATDETPGTPTKDQTVTVNTSNNAIRSHNFTGLPVRTAGKWRMRFYDGSLWGPWSLLRNATTAVQPGVPGQPAVEPGTLTPRMYASLVSGDPADFITAAEINVWQDPAQGSTITKWASGKVAIGGSPNRAEVNYGGSALIFGQQYRWVIRLWNRDDVASEFTGNLFFTPRESVGPTIKIGSAAGPVADLSTKIDTVTPTFNLSDPGAANIDQARLWVYSATGTLLWDSGVVDFAAAANRNIAVPANTLDWGQNPRIEGAIRISGNANMGPVGERIEVHINAAPGSPYPVELLPLNEIKRITITGSPTGGTFTLTFAGRTTAGIAHNATAAVVQAALEALDNIDSGDILASGGPLPGTVVDVEFTGRYGNRDIAQASASGAGLTGGTTPSAAWNTLQDGNQAVPRADGVWVSDEKAPFVRYPFRDADKDLGYTESPTRREIEVRTLADAHFAASPYVITTGITDDFELPVLTDETTFKTRARYDDTANVRSGWSDYLLIKHSDEPTLTNVLPASAAVLTAPRPTISWDYASLGSKAQVAWQVIAQVAGNRIYDSGQVAGTETSHRIPAGVLPNATTVVWSLEVWDSDGLSTLVAREFTTDFTQPPALTGLVLTPDPESASLIVEWDASLLDPDEFSHYLIGFRVADQWVTIATIEDQATTRYRFRAVPHNADVQIRVHQHNGFEASDATADTALVELIGYWRQGPDMLHQLRHVRVGGHSGEPKTLVEEFDPPFGGSIVQTWGTAGYRGQFAIFVPPDSDLLSVLREDKRLGRSVWLKFPKGEIRLAKITAVPDTDREVLYRDVGLSYTEIEPVEADYGAVESA